MWGVENLNAPRVHEWNGSRGIWTEELKWRFIEKQIIWSDSTSQKGEENKKEKGEENDGEANNSNKNMMHYTLHENEKKKQK